MESRVQHMKLYIQDTMTRRHGCGLLFYSWLMYIVTMGALRCVALRASSKNPGLYFFFHHACLWHSWTRVIECFGAASRTPAYLTVL